MLDTGDDDFLSVLGVERLYASHLSFLIAGGDEKERDEKGCDSSEKGRKRLPEVLTMGMRGLKHVLSVGFKVFSHPPLLPWKRGGGGLKKGEKRTDEVSYLLLFLPFLWSLNDHLLLPRFSSAAEAGAAVTFSSSVR
jgi:hypothetical protein